MTVTTEPDPTCDGTASQPRGRGRIRRGLAAGVLAAGILVLGAAGPAAAAPAATVLVSVGLLGVVGNASSGNPEVSADGRFVAFASAASNLVRGDTNGREDVFVRDLLLGTTVRASVSSSGEQADGASREPSISADGRFVAFSSVATNLVGGDTNGREDVFVRDLVLGTTTRVSVSSDGVEADRSSYFPSISADGRFVAFTSIASNLVAADTNQHSDVFVHDLLRSVTFRVSVSQDAGQANGGSNHPSISTDGRRVAFASAASNLVPGDTNGLWDVFVRDLVHGTTVRANLSVTGQQTSSESPFNQLNPAISADGRFVAFVSGASNLVRGDTNHRDDVFVRDLTAETTIRASVSGTGSQATGHSRAPSISAGGRFVAFHSYAPDLVAGDTNGEPDVFVRDLSTRTTIRASVTSTGGQTGGGYAPSISADGRWVAFRSPAPDLVPGDTNNASDAFAHHLTPPVLHRPAHTG